MFRGLIRKELTKETKEEREELRECPLGKADSDSIEATPRSVLLQ
jgi:hypothetical protein